jgi:hypothetical protein
MRSKPLFALLIFAQAVARSEISPVTGEEEPELSLPTGLEEPGDALIEEEIRTGAAEPGTRGNAGTVPPDVNPSPDLDAETAGPEPLPGKASFKTAVVANLSSAFDDNIYISRSKQADFIQSVAISLYAGWGDFRTQLMRPESGIASRFDHPETSRSYLYGGYTPRFSWFIDHSKENSLNHDALIRGGTAFGKVRLSFEARLRTLSEPDLDLGTRTDRTITSGVFNAEYALSTKTKIETALTVESRDYSQGIDSTEATLTTFLDYQWMPKTHVAAGFALGYLTPDGLPDQTYEQALVRATWRPVQRVFASLAVGAEFRQVGSWEMNTPVFDAALGYDISETQQFVLEASRRTTVSVSQFGENIQLTSAGVRYRIKFIDRVYATIFGGYQHADYNSFLEEPGPARTEDFLRVGASLACEVTANLVTTLGYEHQENFSSLDVRDFTRNLTELKINLHF